MEVAQGGRMGDASRSVRGAPVRWRGVLMAVARRIPRA